MNLIQTLNGELAQTKKSPTLWQKQVVIFRKKSETELLKVEVRFDDQCNNKHNSFAVTGELKEKHFGVWTECMAGCIHEEIIKWFPELAHLIKWHLMDSTGPTHYVANTTWHAGSKDCSGRLKGEPYNYVESLTFDSSPVQRTFKEAVKDFIKYKLDFNAKANKGNPERTPFQPLEVPHLNVTASSYNFAPKYSFQGLDLPWHNCPFDALQEAHEYCTALNTLPITWHSKPTAWGEGKIPDLKAARSTAVWPDATDDDLLLPGLEERLEARLPALLADFRKDLEAFGFQWEPGE